MTDTIESLRALVAELEAENADFESDIDICTQHNVELQLQLAAKDQCITELKAKNTAFSDLADLMQKSLEGDTTRISELLDQLAAQALTIKTMREALNSWINIAANCVIESGCCCCGETMKRHSHPMACGHSPVDMADWIVRKTIEETDKTLSLSDNSTEILQEWLDKQLGEPVSICQSDEYGMYGTPLYRKPEIKK